MNPKTIAIIIALITISASVADAAPQRRFGNGRLLRRLAGLQQQKKDNNRDKNRDSKNSDRKPTPANRAKAPTPAQRPTGSNARTPQQRPSPNAGSSQKGAPVTRSATKTNRGFGMQMQTYRDKIVVTQVLSYGNAAKAGFRQGDIVVAAGGVKLESIEEFNEITDILGQGDQIELEISRRGKSEKLMLQFGEAPKEGEVTADTPAPKEAPGSATRSQTASRKNPYSFVPEPSRKSNQGLRSVLEGSGSRK